MRLLVAAVSASCLILRLCLLPDRVMLRPPVDSPARCRRSMVRAVSST